MSSRVPLGHWPYAFEMAVDMLNRTTGPTAVSLRGATTYELLTGERPRVMSIMPCGCRAFAIKPRPQYLKSTIEPHAWVGYNLGRSLTSPGAYHVYIPSTGGIVTTSEVYFWEHHFPCRPCGERFDESAGTLPTPANADPAQPPGVPATGVIAAAKTVAESQGATDGDTDAAPQSRRYAAPHAGHLVGGLQDFTSRARARSKNECPGAARCTMRLIRTATTSGDSYP